MKSQRAKNKIRNKHLRVIAPNLNVENGNENNTKCDDEDWKPEDKSAQFNEFKKILF